jgi:hypothetical protein
MYMTANSIAYTHSAEQVVKILVAYEDRFHPYITCIGQTISIAIAKYIQENFQASARS